MAASGVCFVPNGTRPWAHSHAALPDLSALVVTSSASSTVRAMRRSGPMSDGWTWKCQKARGSATWRASRCWRRERTVRSTTAVSVLAVSSKQMAVFRSITWAGISGFAPLGGTRSGWRDREVLQEPFKRFSPGPILDRSPEDPYTLSYPCVLQFGPRDWRMWYGSNLAPAVGNADMQHAIKLARSVDGVHWTRDGKTVLGLLQKPNMHSRAQA